MLVWKSGQNASIRVKYEFNPLSHLWGSSFRDVFLYQKNSISKSENDKGEDLQDILVIFFSDISVIVNS